MADESMSEEEARRRFVAYLIAVDARGPAPDCEEQLAAIHAEFDIECEKMLAEDVTRRAPVTSHR